MNAQAIHCITVDARGCGKVDNRTAQPCQAVRGRSQGWVNRCHAPVAVHPPRLLAERRPARADYTQITPFGRSPDGHADDRDATHIGGCMRGLLRLADACAELAVARDNGWTRVRAILDLRFRGLTPPPDK